MVKPTAQGWEIVPPTPPYEGKPDIGPEAVFAIGSYLNTCRRKRRYEEPGDAAVNAAVINRNNADADVEVYACRHCRGWHVGSRSKHKNKQERGREIRNAARE